ncbi:MAG: hypothetical protein AABY88_08365 [Pseudomonadota bacterium]
MTTTIGKMVAAATLAALTVTSANAACWSPASVSAAKVRDFEAMLRSASVRCSKEVPVIKAAYSRFVTLSRPAFVEANNTVRAHFAADNGLVGSFSAYNTFLASITNSYGPGTTGIGCADFAAFIDAANAEGAAPAVIARLADEAGASPTLVGQRCSNRVAAPRVVAMQQVAVNK